MGDILRAAKNACGMMMIFHRYISPLSFSGLQVSKERELILVSNSAARNAFLSELFRGQHPLDPPVSFGTVDDARNKNWDPVLGL